MNRKMSTESMFLSSFFIVIIWTSFLKFDTLDQLPDLPCSPLLSIVRRAFLKECRLSSLTYCLNYSTNINKISDIKKLFGNFFAKKKPSILTGL